MKIIVYRCCSHKGQFCACVFIHINHCVSLISLSPCCAIGPLVSQMQLITRSCDVMQNVLETFFFVLNQRLTLDAQRHTSPRACLWWMQVPALRNLRLFLRTDMVPIIFTTTGGHSPTHNVSAPAENITRNIYVIVNDNGFCTLKFLHL